MNDLYQYTVFYGAFVWVVVLAAVAVPAMVPYILLRIKKDQNKWDDPELGLKVALHFLISVAVLLTVSALSVMAADLAAQSATEAPANRFRPANQQNELLSEVVRFAAGVALAGGLLWGAHWYVLWGKTNNRRFPGTRRMFVGCRFIICGLMVTFALAGGLASAFQAERNSDGQTTAGFFGFFTVWLVSWVAHAALLMAYTKQPDAPYVAPSMSPTP